MTPSPILRVLSSLLRNQVAFLMMGGQACILYGAAEFSRDLDVSLRIDEANLDRLQSALSDLDAEQIYHPELSREALETGHACHFRCNAADASGLRLDVMGRQRGVAPWDALWSRRVEIQLPDVGGVPVMSLADLIQAKKTQRDKDWPMIRRLVEADVQAHAPDADEDRVTFWLAECRTPEILLDLAVAYPSLSRAAAASRGSVTAALRGDLEEVRSALHAEENDERRRDREYWAPLRKQLDEMRHARRGRPKDPADPHD